MRLMIDAQIVVMPSATVVSQPPLRAVIWFVMAMHPNTVEAPIGSTSIITPVPSLPVVVVVVEEEEAPLPLTESHLLPLVFLQAGNIVHAGCKYTLYRLRSALTRKHSDNANGRILPVGVGASQTTTVQSCIAACQAQNFSVAGMEFSGMLVV